MMQNCHSPGTLTSFYSAITSHFKGNKSSSNPVLKNAEMGKLVTYFFNKTLKSAPLK